MTSLIQREDEGQQENVALQNTLTKGEDNQDKTVILCKTRFIQEDTEGS